MRVASLGILLFALLASLGVCLASSLECGTPTRLSNTSLYAVHGADGESDEISAAGICESSSLLSGQVSQYGCAGHPAAPCVACVPSSYSDIGLSNGGYHRDGTQPGCSLREKKIGICVNPKGVYSCDNPQPTNPKSYCVGNTPKLSPQAP